MQNGRRVGHGVTIVFTLIAVQASAALATDSPPAQLSVQIVPASSHPRSGRWLYLSDDGSRHFHVVLTNASKEPIRLWEEWCGWGYFSLSFEARDSKGKVVVISKKPRGWDKNFPCPVELAAGEQWVVNVGLEPAIWENSPLAGDSGKATTRLKAIYEIREDGATRKEKVWTGKVSSPELEYNLTWMSAATKRTRLRLQNARP
jgi:hypothetical protein